MKYRKEIDGLRAVAIIPVILFHAGFKIFEGGFIGVDVFFVISGYLITTIILADIESGTFSISNFYERRARRILPALFFIMLCCLPFAWFVLTPNHLKDFYQSVTAVSVFSSNILFWKESGYFDTATELKPLMHTWSLAVEEQYYVIFPLFLIVLWKMRKQLIWGFLVAVTVISLGVAQWGAYNKPSATFFLLPTRVWELAIGALIAYYFLFKKNHVEFVTSNKTISEALGLFGLVLICYSIFAFGKSTPFPSLYALIPTIGTALIITFSSPETTIGRLLSKRPLVGMGLISYSTYLWHQPLFAFARHMSLKEPSVVLILTLTLLSILFAYFSWRYVEMPFRDRKAISKNNIFIFTVVGSVIFATTGLAGYINKGFESIKKGENAVLNELSEKVRVNYGLSEICEDEFTLSPSCRTSDEPEILIWGDSYAMHLVQGILSSNPSANIIQMTKTTCGPFFDVAPVDSKYPLVWAEGCLEFTQNVHNWLKSNKTVKYVVLSSFFAQYIGDNQLLVKNKLYGASNELVFENFIETLQELKNMGITPVVFSPTPQNGENIGGCLMRAEFWGNDLDLCDFSQQSISEKNNDVYKLLNNISNSYKVVLLEEGICADGVCKASIDSTFIYRDSGHLSISGSALLGKKMRFYDLIVGNNSTPANTKDLE